MQHEIHAMVSVCITDLSGFSLLQQHIPDFRRLQTLVLAICSVLRHLRTDSGEVSTFVCAVTWAWLAAFEASWT